MNTLDTIFLICGFAALVWICIILYVWFAKPKPKEKKCIVELESYYVTTCIEYAFPCDCDTFFYNPN
jgi:hypothetical protein